MRGMCVSEHMAVHRLRRRTKADLRSVRDAEPNGAKDEIRRRQLVTGPGAKVARSGRFACRTARNDAKVAIRGAASAQHH